MYSICSTSRTFVLFPLVAGFTAAPLSEARVPERSHGRRYLSELPANPRPLSAHGIRSTTRRCRRCCRGDRICVPTASKRKKNHADHSRPDLPYRPPSLHTSAWRQYFH
ncbi:hypothetical protein B0H14DRAFT_873944 [Mycena olivaceomarginata]|nr:hypothetical protein B0H14DRAFT_873944 [Mycena olivaceomarginata]